MEPQVSPPANSESSQPQSKQSTPNTQKTVESDKQLPDSTEQPIKKDIIPPKPPFKFTHSKKWITIEAILLLIVIVLATSYSLYRNAYKPQTLPPPATPTPKLTQTPTPDLTTDWKTYRNDEYGFELIYPPDWEIYDRLNEKSTALQILKTGPTNSILEWSDGSILIISPTDSENIDLTKELSVPKEIIDQFNTQVFNFSSWNGHRWKTNTDDLDNYSDSIIATRTTPDGKILKMSWSQTNFNNDLTAEKYLFQILSTFKFLETCSFEDTTCPEGSRCILADGLPGSKGICSNEIPEPEKSCLEKGGRWIQELFECDNVNETICKDLRGEYFDCSSPSECRMNNHLEDCPNVCTQVCKF